MKILITGATGFIGSQLVKHLHHQYQLTVLSRPPIKAYQSLGNDIEVIDDLELLNNLNTYDAVINLAGEPIAKKRWTQKQKQKICQSRWKITEQLQTLFNQSSTPPEVLISGSAIGYYGNQNSKIIDESFSGYNNEFTHSVCKHWEELAQAIASDKTRVCIVRTGIVLGKNGGALQKMLPPFQFCLGGPLGSGEQYLSWIHISDMVGVIIHLLEKPQSNGIYNATAPTPVTSKEFSCILGNTLKRPYLIRTPSWILKLLMGEMSTLVIGGQRVIPQKLLDEGYQFCHPDLNEALDIIINTE